MTSFNESLTPGMNLEELPLTFVPGERDVVIGKGKKFYFHSGNQWLRTLVANMLSEYTQAQTKSDKSNVISKVVDYVQVNGRFVKRELKTGMWVYAEPLLCREKCSQTFRDNLAQTYRSSNIAKRNKRRQEQHEKKCAATNCGTEVPEAKRMRTCMGLSTTSCGIDQDPIPSSLFDLDLALWSPKVQAPSVGFDIAAFDMTHRRSSMAGAAGGSQFTLNMQPRNSYLSSAPCDSTALTNNLNLSNWLSHFAQSLNASNASASSSASNTDQSTSIMNPFEPTPLPAMPDMPPLMSRAAPTQAATGDFSASSFSSDANPIFGAFENAFLQQASNQFNSFQPQQHQQQQYPGAQQKRHSLASLMDDEWFNFLSPTNDDSHQNISAAFAA